MADCGQKVVFDKNNKKVLPKLQPASPEIE